ncbi:glycosyltransferase family 2 protein [Candidatus Saccharibacteria bacterium]|nr:glycosyltransferase family 2 protein [Candidatus Saccharibacteria bacterium]
MISLSKLKQTIANNRLIPKAYAIATRPFEKTLRRLPVAPVVPKNIQKVSVVVPNYNYKEYLDNRIKTILEQTYPLYELIILDDASTDGSVEYIKQELSPKIRTFDPNLKLRIIESKKNSGKSIHQWKKAFKEASGDFLWIAEADDSSDPNFLNTVMAKFAQDKDVVLAFSNSVAIDSQGSVLTYDFQNRSADKLKADRFKNDFIVKGEVILKQEFAINCIIPNVSGVVFRLDRKTPFESLLQKASEFTQCGDWYFYSRVLEHGSIAYSRSALNFFRIHQKSVTASSKKTSRLLEEVQSMHALINKNYSLSPAIMSAQKAEELRIKRRQN